MEAGDREAIQRFWLRGLAQKVDCRKDLRLDQSQSPSGSRLRALRHDRRRLRPPRHDPHHAQAACCKPLVMNPNFPDGFLGTEYSTPEVCKHMGGGTKDRSASFSCWLLRQSVT